MPYLIETDQVIELLGEVPASLSLLDELAETGVAMSLITWMEVYEGLLRKIPADAERTLDRLTLRVPVLAFSSNVARRCARVREELRREGRRIRLARWT